MYDARLQDDQAGRGDETCKRSVAGEGASASGLQPGVAGASMTAQVFNIFSHERNRSEVARER